MKLITSAQMRAARALVRWSAEELALNSKVGVATIRRAESADGVPTITEANCNAIQAALEAAGVIFVAENGEGPGVRLRKSAETAAELTKQIEAIGAELAETDHDAPVSPSKGMQQLEDAHKANKAVKLKNKRAKVER